MSVAAGLCGLCSCGNGLPGEEAEGRAWGGGRGWSTERGKGHSSLADGPGGGVGADGVSSSPGATVH